MITFIIALLVLIAGYLIYGRIVEKIVAPSDAPTPAMAHPDGVDFTPMKKWRERVLSSDRLWARYSDLWCFCG